MQNIQIPDDQYEKLTGVVQAAGYGDVQAFLAALAEGPTQDPRGTLSKDELAASLEMIRKSEEDIQAGRCRPLREAMIEIADRHDFDR